MISKNQIALSIILCLISITFSSSNCPLLCEAQSCSSYGYCSLCQKNFYVSQTQIPINGNCPCPNGFYMDSTQYCRFCPIQCQTCSSATYCTSCIPGYQISNGVCKQKYTYSEGWLINKINLDLTNTDITNYNYRKYVFTDLTGGASSSSSLFTYCSKISTSFFGGFLFGLNTNVFRSYFGLPYHQWVDLHFQFVAIDNWEGQDFMVNINEQNSYLQNQTQTILTSFIRTFNSTQRVRSSLCGSNSYSDSLGIVSLSFQHTKSMMKFSVKIGSADPSQSGVYFGIRNVFMRVGTCKRDCERCSSYDVCLECKPLYNKTTDGKCICNTDIALMTSYGCRQKCKVGSFQLYDGSGCLLCQQFLPNCKLCSNSTTCIECRDGSLLQGQKCVQQCPFGYMINSTSQTFCTKCPNGCLDCVNNLCLVCEQGKRRVKGQCLDKCPNATYPDPIIDACIPCNPNCAVCLNFQICTQCKTDLPNVAFELVYGECIPLCDQQNYSQIISSDYSLDWWNQYICSNITCHSDCEFCFGSNSNQCKACSGDLVLELYSCIATCSDGFYLDGIICRQCPYWCSNCSTQICYTCSEGYFKYKDSCLLYCPNGFYHDTNQCLPCSSNCGRCNRNNYCITCNAGYFLNQGKCTQQLSSCPVNQYLQTRLSLCIDCPQNCSQCYKTLCYECTNNTYLDNGKCVIQCLSIEKIKTSHKLCAWKNPLCEMPSNGQDPTCTSCMYLNPPLAFQNGECLFQCPSGKDVNQDTQLCSNCVDNCKICYHQNGYCYRCKENYVIDENGNCTIACPVGYLSDSVQCILCPSGCQVCLSDGSCTSCAPGLNLNPLSKRCSKCSSLSQYYDTNANQCMSCSNNCRSCVNQKTSCTSCSSGNYLILSQGQNYCSSNCFAKFFKDQISRTCQPCKPQCATCIAFDQCTSCVAQFGLFKGQCLHSCPINFYMQILPDLSMICQKCANNCLSCYGPLESQCLTCYTGDYLDHTTCVNNCPINKYGDSYGHCDWCHPICQRCYGPADFQCLYCQNDYYMYRGVCYSICPAGTFQPTSASKICYDCEWGCASCENNTKCTQCFGGYYLSQGICYKNCPIGSYDNYNSTCFSCTTPSCSQCNSAGCVRCIHPYYRYNKTCVESCPLGTYEADHNLRQCLPCPAYCSQCTSPHDCKKCTGKYKLKGGYCQSNCTDKTYFDNITQACKACPSNCSSCSSNTTCTSCQEMFYLYNNQCVASCQLGTYLDISGYCKPCSPNCISCSSFSKCENCLIGYTLKEGYCTNSPPICNVQQCSFCSSIDKCLLCSLPFYLLNNTCIENCPAGYLPVGRQCENCLKGCSKCSGSYDNCTLCSVGLFLLGNNCVANCPSGYYMDQNSKCQKCTSYCSKCTNISQCLVCENFYVLVNGICQEKCPEGTAYSQLEQICLQCSDSCKKCTSIDYCDQCNFGYYLYDGQCYPNCPDFHYITVASQCKPCQFPCLRCQSQSSKCKDCVQGYVLNGTKCQSSCNIGYYKSIQNQCKPCQSKCKSCLNETFCLSCPSGYSYFNNTCVQKCSSRTYSSNGVCVQCSNYCLQCQDGDGKCISCANGTLLYDGKCVTKCPSGTYNNSLQTCKNCDFPCKTCNTSSIYGCKTCIQGYYYLNGRCLNICPQGYFADYSVYACYPCRTYCTKCVGINNCTSCQTPYSINSYGTCDPSSPPNCTKQNCILCQNPGLTTQTCQKCESWAYLYNGVCVQQCPDGTYADFTKNCISCSVNCKICNSTQCKTCKTGFYLYLGQCWSACPTGSLVKSGTYECVIDPCQSYSSNEDQQCQNCVSPYTLNLQNDSCVSNCPTGTYQLYGKCQNCQQFCQQCTGVLNCNNCQSGYILYQGICITICPTGTVNISNKCTSCSQILSLTDTVCLECTATSCSHCKIGYYLNDGNCVQNCPIGKYPNLFTNMCQYCNSNCSACSSATNCYQCEASFYLQNGKCTQKCRDGSYPESSSCLPCSPGCSICTNSSNCVSCQNGKYLLNGRCTTDCPTGYISYINQCIPCTANCSTCSGFSSSCSSCPANYYLLNKKCLTACPDGYYGSQGICKQCAPQCATCISSSSICKQCLSNYVMDQYGNCYQDCPLPTQYYDSYNHVCKDCSLDCYTCYGPLYTQCTSCQNGLVLFKDQCVPACPASMYSDGSICKYCDLINCKTCEKSAETCTSCYQGYVISNEKCVNNCPDNYYLNIVTMKCQACHNTCQNCQGPLPDDCTECPIGQYLMYTGKCANSCPTPTMRLVNGQCQPCENSCLECDTNGCTLCSTYTYLYNGKCVTVCPVGTYISSNQCISCALNGCSICQSSTSCKGCKVGYLLYEGTCITACPSGYIEVNGICLKQQCNGYILTNGTITNCVASCPDGYYPVQSSMTCIPCSINNCLRCSDNSNCNVCKSGFIAFNNQCVTTCPTNYLLINGQCLQCSSPCSKCILQLTTCSQCEPGYNLINQKCLSTCPNGYYAASGKCVLCKSQCETCTNGADCATCKNSQYLTPNCNTSSCLSSQYKRQSDGTCQPCSTTCLTCYDGTSTNCLSCPNGKILIQGQCRSVCPVGYFNSSTNCQPCPSQCYSCASLTNCISCKAGFLLVNNKCVSSCSDLNTAAINYVLNSNGSCTACPQNCSSCINLTNCSSCNTGYLYNGGCVSNCPAATYLSANGVCVNCQSPCLNCKDSATQCTSCISTKVLYQNQCITNCPIGYYSNNGVCSTCTQQNCLDCTSSVCNSCQSPYMLATDQTCTKCVEGYYYAGISCTPCSTTCKSCTTFNQCNTCFTGMFLTSTKQCVYSCPAGQIAVGNQCKACQNNCNQCSSTTNCSSCTSPYFLYNGNCVSTCPSNTFSKNQICNQCPSGCLTCSSLTNCNSCVGSKIVYNGMCIDACPDGTALEAGSCVKCKTGCKSCPNGINVECPICDSNLIPNTDGSCITPANNCLPGEYLDVVYNKCKKCDPTCAQCTSSGPLDCKSCPTGYTLTSSGSCQSPCSSHQYSNNGVCTQCPTQCETCSASGCKTCPSGKILSVNDCITECPSNTYKYNQICEPCPAQCLTCTSLTKCQTCKSTSTIFYNNMCYTTCPDGSYPASGSCSSCPSNCTTCTSGTSCSSCNYPYFLNDTQCVATCPTGKYPDLSTNKCQNCSTQCTSCNSANNCQSCISGKYLQNGACVSNCSAKYYANSLKQCIQCVQPCENCTSATNCQSCISGFFLVGTQCENNCPDGQYADSNGVCTNCIVQNCKICDNSPTCFNCSSGYYLYGNNNCTSTCPDKYYADSTTKQCKACTVSNCKTCTNSGNTCQTCINNLKLYENKCVNSCPLSTYEVNNKCYNCSSNCLICTDQNTCTRCNSPTYSLFAKKCVQNCPTSYFSTNSTINSTCQPCETNCITCYDSTNCSNCTTGFVLDFNNICVHQNCINCKTDKCTDFNCTQCESGFYAFNGKCSTQCPTQDYYANQTLGICDVCINNCIICPNSTHCTQCINGFGFTIQTGCVQEGYLEFGVVGNMSGFTSNITQITSAVYLGTAVGPVVFGQIGTTYFNIQFTQMMFFHKSQAGDNKQMDTFLDSLSSMALSSNSQNAQSRRLLQSGVTANSFLETNMYIFIMMGVFLVAFLSILAISKLLPIIEESWPNLFFYLHEICDFCLKRFKWIYFDFLAWMSYLPFLYFALVAVKNISFSTGLYAISSLISIAILLIYPFYPIFICYILKSNYNELCLKNNQLLEMSLQPYAYKVRRPIQIPEQGNFRYITVDNFRLILNPLKYFRKFIFVLVVAICPIPVASICILIVLNILFIGYLIALRPREFPFWIIDLVIQFVILAFEIFMLVYISIDSTRVTIMSIVTQAVGFIAANLSIIIGIILNLIAYIKIFICIYKLIKHLRDKYIEKEQMKLKEKLGQQQQSNQDPIANDEKILNNIPHRNDDSVTQDDIEDDPDNNNIYKMIDEKDLLANGIDINELSKNKDQDQDIPQLKISQGNQRSEELKRNRQKRKEKRKKNAVSPVDCNSDEYLSSNLQQSPNFKKKNNNQDQIEGGKIKNVTRDKYKRKKITEPLDKIVSVIQNEDSDQFQKTSDAFLKKRGGHPVQEIDNFDNQFQSPIRKGKISDKIKNDKPTNGEDIQNGNLRDRKINLKEKPSQTFEDFLQGETYEINRLAKGKAESNIPELKQINNNPNKKATNGPNNSNYPQLKEVFGQYRKARKNSSEDPSNIKEGEITSKDKNKNKKVFQDEDQPIGEIDFRERSGKKQKNDNELQEGLFKNRKSKNKSNGDREGQVAQGFFNERKGKGKYDDKQQDQLAQGYLKERRLKDKNQIQNYQNQLDQGNMKQREKLKQGQAFDQFDQLLQTKIGDNSNVQKGNLIQRQKNKMGKNLLSNEDSYDTTELQFKDNNPKRKGKIQANDQYLDTKQYQDAQLKTFENKPNKFKRNVNNLQNKNNQQKAIGQLAMKEREAKNKEKNNNIFQKASEDQISEGKFADRKGNKTHREDKKKEQQDVMKHGNTVDFKGKKVEKQAKGFFENFMKQQGEQSVVFQDKKSKRKDIVGENSFQQDQYGKRRSKENNTARVRDQYLQSNEGIQQSYDDIVRRNKKNAFVPQINKGKGSLNINDASEEIEESMYERKGRQSKRSERVSHDRGLGIHDRQSQSEGQQSLYGARKQRALASQRNRSKINKHMNMNESNSDMGDDDLSPQARRKKQKQIQRRENKSGILKIKRDDQEDDLESIQL